MKRFILSAFCWLQIAPAAMAMRDANLNGLSDIWEKLFNNGNLFPASFNPLADPDGDGWTNLQEATVGTDPFNSQAPEGFLAPAIMIFRPDPGGNPSALPIYRLTWPTFEGKAYQVFISTDLQPASWIAASEAILGRGIALTYDAEALHSNGTSPPALFWRIQVADTNSDSDNLNDWEEGRLGTLPDHPDTDRDGIPDHLDVAPFDSAVLADPDGLNLPPGALANLVGWWDMQPQPSSNSPLTIASRASDLSGAKHPLNQQYGLPNPYSFAGKGIMTPPAAPAAINLLALGSNSSLRGKSSFTIHYWLRLKKDRLAVTGSFFIPPEVTLASYGSVGTQPPNIEWSAIRSPSGGTRFLLDDGNRPNSTKWFTPGAHDSPVPIDDNRWHHLALVIGGNNTRMFLDGKKIGPTSGNLVSFGIPSTIYQNNGYLIVGGTKKLPASGSGNANPISDLIGEVDSIMLNSRVLDSADPLIFEKIHHRDRDSDGLWDITEVSSELWRDQNSNGVLTATELTYRSNPNQWQDPLTSDVDGDGLTDVREQNETNTSIWNPDTDGDLLPDGWEVDNGLNPNNQTGVHGAAGDREPDGVSNLDEYRNGSDPNLGDTDGDRTSDSDEINGPDGDPNTDDGSNPNDPSDNGRQLPPEERITIKLGIGDQSGSESEDYVMNVFHIVPDTGRERRIHTLRSGGFGKFKEQTLSIFRRGETYTFQIDWQNTNNKDKPASGGNPPDGPDYDYTFKVEPQGDFPGLLLDSYDPKTKSIDQSKPLLAEGADNVAESQQEFEQNFEGRRVILLPVEVTVVKEGETAAPEDGLVVKKTDTVRYRLSPGLPDAPLLLEDKIQWHWRILKWDGTYSAWTAYQDGQGHTFTAQPEDAGIYEVRASMGGQDFPLKRKEDAHHAEASSGHLQEIHKKGSHDCFGIVEQQWQIDLRDKAHLNLGSTRWKKNAELILNGAGDFPNPSDKCNAFVYEQGYNANTPVPLTRGNNPFAKYPPLAIDWWNDNSGRTDDSGRIINSEAIPGWQRLPDATYPQPGFVVSRANLAENPTQYHSHVGILDYDGSWISAGSENVNKYYHPSSTEPDGVTPYQPQGYRKYIGGN